MDFEKFKKMFGIPFKVASHQDYLDRIFFLFRWYHKIFVAKKYPCCIEYKKNKGAYNER